MDNKPFLATAIPGTGNFCVAKDGEIYCSLPTYELADTQEDKAKRIALCLNAMDGFSNADIEKIPHVAKLVAGVVFMREALQELVHGYDRLCIAQLNGRYDVDESKQKMESAMVKACHALEVVK